MVEIFNYGAVFSLQMWVQTASCMALKDNVKESIMNSGSFYKKLTLASLMLLFSGVVFFAGCLPELAVTSGGEEKLFDYRQITLDNGLEVVTLEDFSTPIVAAQV